eukprot:CAMPEP_0113490188 /NCGR_PEP_ID=MMETSP0014_2-20120614/26916_1 /TAXON_ID=2857 /ORGANISM="Nitzschia sp." /LENGTH=654 /DNA_ID=CAMNT_0000383949 /DNA_START=332 /DNA_END=2296 /DNA_ORIENTATION=- /assembly_acc=CAM_ASM_000159
MDTSNSGSNRNNNANVLHHHHHHQSALSAALASAAAANNAASLTAALNDAANGSIRPGGVAHASIVQSLSNAASAAATAAGGDNHLAFATGNTGGVSGATPSADNSSSSSSSSDVKNNGTSCNSASNSKQGESSKNANSNKGRKLCSLPNSSTAPSQSNDDRPFNTGRWSDEEHQRFLDGLSQYGTGNWKKITEMVGTRSCTQIRTHAQKYFIALQKPAGGVVEKGKKGGSVGSLSRKGSKMITNGAYSGSYGVSELHQHISPRKGSSGTKRSKRRKLRLTKGGRHSPKSNGALAGLTGIEALARAAEAESETMSHESDSEAEDDSDSDRRKRARLLDANDQPPYEDEADDSDEEEEEDDDDDGSKSHDESPPPRRTVQRTSSMIGAAASIASLANAGSKGTTVAGARESADDVESLREQMGVATETLFSLQKQNREMEIQLLTTIEEKNRAVADCKTLQELNAQIQAEHRRALIMLEQSQQKSSGSGGSGSFTPQQAAEMEARLAQDPQIIAVAAANGMSPQDLARLHRQQQEQQQNTQNGQAVEMLHAQLTEAEVRFHQVTESLTRQTQVLTDQHRAILELNEKLESEKAARQKEKAAREALEAELQQYKKGDADEMKEEADTEKEEEEEEEELEKAVAPTSPSTDPVKSEA